MFFLLNMYRFEYIPVHFVKLCFTKNDKSCKQNISMEKTLKFDESEMVSLNNLEMAVSSFRTSITNRTMTTDELETSLDTETGKFLVTVGEKRIVQASALYLGQYTIPESPLSPVYWKTPSGEFNDILKTFHPRTHQDCPEWLQTILKSKVMELPDPMIISIIMGAMLEMGNFDSIGYMNLDSNMVAFGLTNIEWLSSELTDDERYSLPDGVFIEKCQEPLKELNSHSKKYKNKNHSKNKKH